VQAMGMMTLHLDMCNCTLVLWKHHFTAKGFLPIFFFGLLVKQFDGTIDYDDNLPI